MHPTLVTALEPSAPGQLVHRARFLPGFAATADQISRYAEYWHSLAREAITAGQPTLVALGDSLTQGIGASRPSAGYVGRLVEKLATNGVQPNVLNLSRSGATMENVLDVQLPALHHSDVDAAWVVCTVGSNDLLRSPRLGRTWRTAENLVGALPQNTVLATVPARGSLLAKLLNRQLVRASTHHAVVVADINARLTTWRGLRAGDRFHPNDAGYELWVEAFCDHLALDARQTMKPASDGVSVSVRQG